MNPKSKYLRVQPGGVTADVLRLLKSLESCVSNVTRLLVREPQIRWGRFLASAEALQVPINVGGKISWVYPNVTELEISAVGTDAACLDISRHVRARWMVGSPEFDPPAALTRLALPSSLRRHAAGRYDEIAEHVDIKWEL